MKKRQVLENEFNELLSEHEFMLKFRGDNELTLIGAPTDNFVGRALLSVAGIAMVTYCLIAGSTDSGPGNTVLIGGALLGLIFTATPFISFYSKKYFKILFSKQTQQINIMNSATGPYKRLDFSQIDRFKIKRVEVDDFVSPDIEIPITYKYAFCAEVDGVDIDIFSIDSKDRSIEAFTNKFGEFISDFAQKPLDVK